MAYPTAPEWKMNITTEDIIYPFADETKTIYRKKTVELEFPAESRTTGTVIVEIQIDKNGVKVERTLTDKEMTVEQFEAFKEWSDSTYKAQVRSFVHDQRRAVTRVDVLEDCPAIAHYDKHIGDEDEDEDDYRTVENALRILENMELTDVQRRRFEMATKGLTTREIAEAEGIAQPCVVRTLAAVTKKKEKYFSKEAAKQGIKTAKK